MNLLKEFKEYIETRQLFGHQHKLLVAVSGGIDSMVLLHLLIETGHCIEVAHANFKLRGIESDQDELLVKTFCKKNKIKLHSKKFNTLKFMKDSKLGVQEAARTLRYDWFQELLVKNKLDFILTAHHANDLAETILFNLARGTGIQGISGIKNKSENKRRPLLFASKNDLLSYGKKQSIDFRQDASNSKDIYSRNYLRLHVIPHLEKLNPSFITQATSFSENIQFATFYYQQAIQKRVQTLIKKNGEQIQINLKKLMDEPYPSHLLFEMIQVYHFNFLQCGQIIKAYQNKHTGALFLSTKYQANLDRNFLLIEPSTEDKKPKLIEEFPYHLMEGESELCFSMVNRKNIKKFSENIQYLNADKLTSPLLLRPIATGDRFQPLGMKTGKKISDYLIDKKIDRFQKQKAMVLCTEENEICALIPFQISENYKLTPDCKTALKIEIKKAGH